MKFRILSGRVSESVYPPDHPGAGQPIIYRPGDVIETPRDLAKRLNSPVSTMVIRVSDDTVASTLDELWEKHEKHLASTK